MTKKKLIMKVAGILKLLLFAGVCAFLFPSISLLLTKEWVGPVELFLEAVKTEEYGVVAILTMWNALSIVCLILAGYKAVRLVMEFL